ncbi:hypothetical protein TWF730_005472 [Orbilia blumenaviensis]|uniref:Uncharacterized protein n=1 Tax=Orbilia blumenaviensis TaxID=1796055 RepID=A0AAV9VLS0_9PEZI
MLQVLLPPTLATRSDGVESHTRSRLPALQSCVQNPNIFSLPSPLIGKEGIFPINVNLKMALPILKTGTKVLKDPELEQGSSSSALAKGKQPASKLVIPNPQKEKFLVGFRGFDASVGLPDSPTESILSEADGFPIAPPLKKSRSESLPVEVAGLPHSISELQLGQNPTTEYSSYVADGFRPGEASVRSPPSYDAIYGALGNQNAISSSSLVSDSTNEAGPLPTKNLHTVPSVSLFRTLSIPSSPSSIVSTVGSPTSSTSNSTSASTPASTPSGPLIYARFPETANQNPRRISLPARAPSTPGLTHSNREIMRIQIRSLFSQFYKSIQFTCNDTEKCLLYGYSDATTIKVPWNIPIERALRQLWKQVMEYDAVCGKVKPESQGKRELATYHAVAMGLISSDLPSERLCTIWDRGLAFATPARRECVPGWLSFTEFVAIVWMVGMAATDPSFH